MLKVYEIDIKGLVQGVGFRPYIYRLARSLNLCGFVDNRTSGVKVILQASATAMDEFLKKLYEEKPAVAEISQVQVSETDTEANFADFRIAPSKQGESGFTRVSPDIAVCNDCLKDLGTQSHRISYPFINCTHCGPRFSIVETIPYDRPATTMRLFEMCDTCRKEYENPENRRFHAQPVACNHCGPSFFAFIDNRWTNDYTTIIRTAAVCLQQGGIVALKGVGGFNWITPATNDQSIIRLRELKQRYTKPFAIICKNIAWVEKYLHISKSEVHELESWRRAIVVLKEKTKLSQQINGELQTLGVMLPYLPVHYDLFRQTDIPAFILTSANRPGEPMLTDNDEAREYLMDKSDFYIENNRPIHNRVDDSVVRIINNRTQILRRARGYTPEPVLNSDPVDGGLAFGAEMTSVFALGKSNEILLSQYIGDLSEHEAFEAYKQTMERLSVLFQFMPAYLVSDLHPGYYSTRYAEEMSVRLNLPLYKVQHHHAHAVSVMVEHNLEKDCLALCLDGTGLGDDSQSWGGELLRCNRSGYRRLGHLPYVAMPGGDKASRECWRMAISYLHTLYSGNTDQLPEDFRKRIGEDKIKSLIRLLQSPMQLPLTSSMGRLFDAVSSLIGICDQNSYQAEAAMRMEHLATQSYVTNNYPIVKKDSWELQHIFDGILSDLSAHTPPADIARRFHNTIVEFLTYKIQQASAQEQISEIILSGGVFQNKLLTELLIESLESLGLIVYYPAAVPCNDGGIAVGQLAIAAAYMKNNITN